MNCQVRIRIYVLLLMIVLGPAAIVGFAPAQVGSRNFNEREAPAQRSLLDKDNLVWAMDVRFKDPRIIKVKLPTRGERICWYVWYQLINRSGKPQEVSPYFEIVTLDNPGIYRDEILITAEDIIRKIEDPTGYQDIKDTVMISKFAIPASKPADEAFPRPITGVAIWDAGPADPKKRDPIYKELADTTRFSIFIRGISNGAVEVDAPAPGLPPITQYKTLQLNYKRKGDRFSLDSRDIEFVSPPQWIYRAATRIIPKAQKVEEKQN